MILSAIKQYLTSRHTVTLHDLAIHFDTDSEVMRDMLQLWVRKGKIRMIQGGSCCAKGCGRGTCTAAEAYQWVRGAAEENAALGC